MRQEKNNNPLFNKKLNRILNIVVSIVFVASCNSLPPPPATLQENSVAPPVSKPALPLEDIDYFTDFGNPYGCAFSELRPLQYQPTMVSPSDIWLRIKIGFQLDWEMEHPRIESELNWYRRHPSYMSRVSKRAQRYIFHVTEEASRRKLPLELALLPIVESAYDPFAYSHGRASGMWQFIPSTGRMYKLKQDWWYDGRRDIIDSTNAAYSYLSHLNKIYDGDWLLSLAAYNSGQGTVNKAIRKNRKKGKATDFWSLDLPKETRSYVPKLLALAKIVARPNIYKTSLYPVVNAPHFTVVETGSQLDLADAAEMAELSIDEVYRLNPGYNRWATSPEGPHRLVVPIANAEAFSTALSALPAEQRLNWQRYMVKPGDSLLLLAKRFNTNATTIRHVNKLENNLIRAGKPLMIPVASKSGKHYSLSAKQRLATIQTRKRGKSGKKQLFYTVNSGDSLWTISRRFKVTTSQLARWNGMSPKDTLRPGQKLSIWSNLPAQASSRNSKRQAMIRKVGYKVRNGDSLARIADRFNLMVTDILKWNAVNPKKYLQPGQRLTLYVDVTSSR